MQAYTNGEEECHIVEKFEFTFTNKAISSKRTMQHATEDSHSEICDFKQKYVG